MKKNALVLALSVLVIAAGSYLAINRFNSSAEGTDKELLGSNSKGSAIVSGENENDGIRPVGSAVVISADDLRNNFDRLSADAKKQPALAYSLAKLLFECRTLSRSLDSAEELISSNKVPAKSKEKLLGDVEKKAGRCKGLSEKQIESYLELMDFAARSGVVEAQLSYSDYAADSMVSPESIANPQRIVDYKRKSLEYYNLALGAGEVKALGLLSSAYENGILAEKDAYKAYVYAYAYALSKNGSSGANQWLAQMESALTVSQLQSARSEAQQIYMRCCR